MPLSLGAGALGEAVCHRCGGRLLEEAAVERVVLLELSISRETLRELVGHFGRPSLRCPACGQKMHPVRLRSVPLELCTGCGAVWLDAGELSRLSEGRWPEVGGKAQAEEPAGAAPVDDHPSGAASGPPLAWAVLLDADQADAERVVAAFAHAAFRTAQDARTAAQRGHGVVAERIPAVDAERLVAALAAEGLAARMLDASLLDLPAAVRTKEVALDDSALTLADALGRPLAIPWASLRAVAVGLVRVAEAETQLVAPDVHELSQSDLQLGVSMSAPQRARTVIVERDDVLLDVLVQDEHGRRGRFRATRKGMVFRSSAGRTTDARFRALARELVQRAPPSVAMSRGARALRDKDDAWLRYRALRDFELSLRWAWARAHAAGGETP